MAARTITASIARVETVTTDIREKLAERSQLYPACRNCLKLAVMSAISDAYGHLATGVDPRIVLRGLAALAVEQTAVHDELHESEQGAGDPEVAELRRMCNQRGIA